MVAGNNAMTQKHAPNNAIRSDYDEPRLRRGRSRGFRQGEWSLDFNSCRPGPTYVSANSCATTRRPFAVAKFGLPRCKGMETTSSGLLEARLCSCKLSPLIDASRRRWCDSNRRKAPPTCALLSFLHVIFQHMQYSTRCHRLHRCHSTRVPTVSHDIS